MEKTDTFGQLKPLPVGTALTFCADCKQPITLSPNDFEGLAGAFVAYDEQVMYLKKPMPDMRCTNCYWKRASSPFRIVHAEHLKELHQVIARDTGPVGRLFNGYYEGVDSLTLDIPTPLLIGLLRALLTDRQVDFLVEAAGGSAYESKSEVISG